eukprot:1418240-Ditylum_brightwellii.AAC.1
MQTALARISKDSSQRFHGCSQTYSDTAKYNRVLPTECQVRHPDNSKTAQIYMSGCPPFVSARPEMD